MKSRLRFTKSKKACAAVGLVAALLAAGCREPPPPNPLSEPVVELFGQEEAEAPLAISLADYRAAIARLRFQREETLYAKKLPKTLSTHVLDQLIADRVIRAEADRLGVVASTTAIAREMVAVRASYAEGELSRRLADTYLTENDLERSITRRLLKLALLEREAFAKLEVKEAELLAAWNALPEEARKRPARVHAAQIVLPTEEEADAAAKVLKRGGDFAALAREVSITPEAARGGDLGWFPAGQMPTVLEEICAPLQVGEVSHVTPSQFGFHICTVLAREPEHDTSLEEMKPQLRSQLLADKRRAAEARYMTELLAGYRVVRHEQRLRDEN